ncbi:MAG: hypothetical protein ACI8PZ_003992 [Myxococcota bacterium]|jgi:hypothetical protein
MSRGFYEILSVTPEASATVVRAAYGTAVGELGRRRRRLVERGGDPSELDHERARLDDAWRTLRDPTSRRRYDALRAFTADPAVPREGDPLWQWVAPRITPPAAAIAVKLLRSTTRLERLDVLPLAPSASEAEPPTLVPHDDDRTTPGAPREHTQADLTSPGFVAERSPSPAAPVIKMPTLRPSSRPVGRQPASGLSPDLRVVDGTPSSPEVLVLPTGRARPAKPVIAMPTAPAAKATPVRAARAMSSEDIARLVDAHGHTGALLRSVREARGLSLEQISGETRISMKYLEALEADDFSRLPSATFVRGYVRELARQLRLDPESVAAGYMRHFTG